MTQKNIFIASGVLREEPLDRPRSVVFITERIRFLKYLRAAKANLNEYEFPRKKIANVQSQLEQLVDKNYYLNRSAKDGYRSYLLAYASHGHKNIFDVHL